MTTITTTGETIVVTSSTGVRFRARIIRVGEHYGATNSLVAEKNALVEFYDTRYPHTEYGQFVSRYFVDTLLEETYGGLNLDTGVEEWSIDYAAMDVVRAWLRLQDAR